MSHRTETYSKFNASNGKKIKAAHGNKYAAKSDQLGNCRGKGRTPKELEKHDSRAGTNAGLERS